MSATRANPATRDETATHLAPRWHAVVHNDPVNLMGYVVLVFKKVLGMNDDDARRHMLEVHRLGRSIVWTGDREAAEMQVHALQHWHLRATLEPEDAHD